MRIPWGALLLFAGGIALATAFQESGISDAISRSLTSYGHLPVLLMMVIIIACVVLLSEIASNTATAVLLMPSKPALMKKLSQKYKAKC